MIQPKKAADEKESTAAGKDAAALLRRAKADYKTAEDYWADNRKKWIEDAKFRIPGEGNQWPENIRSKREAEGLPVIEADKLEQYIKQVVNDGRQNRPAIKVRPEDGSGDPEIADALQGLTRHIFVRSNGDEALDTALDHAAGQGYGYFRVLTEYTSNRSFQQDLVVRRVPNPMAVLTSSHELADGADIRYAFVIDSVPKDDFKAKHPNAKATNWESDSFSDGWAEDKVVRVCEYWYKVETTTTLHLLADGTTATAEEYEGAQAAGEEVPLIIDSRADYVECKVKWCRMTGGEILEERDWLGKLIPIIPVYGAELNVNGKVIYSGLVRRGRDPQLLHNISRTAFATRVALSTQAPWMAAAEQIEDYPEWKTANSGKHQVLRYKHLAEDGTPIPPPIRITPSDVPAGFAQDAEMAEHDIQGALGMYSASLGEKSNEKSGRAIMARQREGDTATFHFQDNLNRAIRLLGRILVDAAPKYYDTKRVIRILGEDGTATMATHDPDQEAPVNKSGAQAIYNLGVGEYDVTVESGPSYTTRRVEAAQAMIELTQANPSIWQTHGDLIVKSQDWPGAEEFAERSKLVMPPALRQAIDQAEGPQALPPQVQQAMQAVQQQQQALEQAHGQLTAMAQQLEQEKAATDAEKAKLDAARQELQSQQKVLQSKFEELSAKLELKAMQTAQMVPPVMPPGREEPAIDPASMPPQPQQPPSGGFFTP